MNRGIDAEGNTLPPPGAAGKDPAGESTITNQRKIMSKLKKKIMANLSRQK